MRLNSLVALMLRRAVEDFFACFLGPRRWKSYSRMRQALNASL
jgi:hypothetical protein